MQWMINMAGDAGASLCGPGGSCMRALVSIEAENFLSIQGNWDSHYHEEDDSQ